MASAQDFTMRSPRVDALLVDFSDSRVSGSRRVPCNGQRYAEVRRVLEVGDVLGRCKSVDETTAAAAEAEACLVLVGSDLVDARIAESALAGVELEDRVRTAGDPNLVRRRQRRHETPPETHAQH